MFCFLWHWKWNWLPECRPEATALHCRIAMYCMCRGYIMQFLFADLCFLHLGRLARPRCCCILYIMYSENISRIILPRNLINDQPFYLIYIGTFLCSIFNLNTIVRWCWIGILTRIWGFVSYQFNHWGKFSIPCNKKLLIWNILSFHLQE